MFFCGLGMGAAVTTFFATVADLFQGKNYGSIMGFVTFGFSIGGAFSPWFAGYLNDITGSYNIALGMVTGALVLLSVLRHGPAAHQGKKCERQNPVSQGGHVSTGSILNTP